MRSETGQEDSLRAHEFRRACLGTDGSGSRRHDAGPWDQTGQRKGKVHGLKPDLEESLFFKPLMNNFNMETSLLYQEYIFIVCVCACMHMCVCIYIYNFKKYIIHSICVTSCPSRKSYQKHYYWALLSWVQLQMNLWNCVWIYAKTMYTLFHFTFLNFPLNPLATVQ